MKQSKLKNALLTALCVTFTFFGVFILLLLGATIFSTDEGGTSSIPFWYMLVILTAPGVSASIVFYRRRYIKNAENSTELPSIKQVQIIEKEVSSEDEQPSREIRRELVSHMEKSRDYRRRLQDYSEGLRIREDEIERREKVLSQRESKIEEEITQRVSKEDVVLAEQARKEMEALKEYKVALHETEIRVLDYVKRRERKDIDIFTDIMEDVERFKKYAPLITLDGFQFEEYIAMLLKKNGYANVFVTSKSKDFGADITAEKDSIKYIFQCKYYNSPVGIEAVQEIYGAKSHYDAHIACVVTNNVFTKAAKILAEETKVLLWDCKKVSELQASV